MKAKYIVLRHGLYEQPVVFSELLNHNEVAAQMGGGAISAGFCVIDVVPVEGTIEPIFKPTYVCYGESISLRLKSRGQQDSDILNKMLGVEDY